MAVETKELGTKHVELSFTIPWAEVEAALKASSGQFAATINVPGFRPGKAPYEVVKKQIGEQKMLETIAESIVSREYVKHIKDSKLDVMGAPKIQVGTMGAGNDFTFTAEVWLQPEVTLPEYKGMKIKQDEAKVSDEDLVKALEELQKMRATDKVVDRAIKKGDKATINYELTVDKVIPEGGKQTGFSVEVGKGTVLPEVDEGLVGMKKDEEKTVQVKFPKDYFGKHLQGKTGDFKMKVTQVHEVELPKLDDDFAKTVDGGSGKIKTLDDLKKNLTENIKHEREHEMLDKAQGRMLEDLVGKTRFDVIAEPLVKREQDRMLHELEHSVSRMGMTFEQYLKDVKKTKEDLEKDFKPQAEKRVKTALMLKEIAKVEKIVPDEKVIDAEIQRSMMQAGDNEEMKKFVQSEDYRLQVLGQVRNHQTMLKLSEWNIEGDLHQH